MWWFLATAAAQQLAFPTTTEHAEFFYPTAYYDHAGVDYDCGSIRYSGHRGSDFGGGGFTGMDAGRDITAAAHGVVVAINDGEFDRCTTADCAGGGGFGNYVKLQHASGRVTYYAHLAQWSVTVAVGDSVSCGDKLGRMGSSGYSTGPHIHLDARDRDNNRLDPFAGSCGDAVDWWVDAGPYDGLPGLVCDEGYPECAPVAELTCGDVVQARNDDPGSTDVHEVYGCHTATYTGPEMAYTVRSGADEVVTLTLTGLEADLDIYALETPECMGRSCLGVSHDVQANDELVEVDALADVPFTVVVDGWQDAVSPFTLTVSCDTPYVEPGPEDSGLEETGDPETGDPETGDPTSGDSDEPLVEQPGGCACDASGRAMPTAWLFAGFVPLITRRRARRRTACTSGDSA